MQQLIHNQSQRGPQHQGKLPNAQSEVDVAKSEAVAGRRDATGIRSPPQKMRVEESSKRAQELGRTKKKPGYPDLSGGQASKHAKLEVHARLTG